MQYYCNKLKFLLTLSDSQLINYKKMQPIKTILLASTLITTLSMSAHAEINVVASVKPLHSLVSSVMKGVGKPDLIVKGAASPHTY